MLLVTFCLQELEHPLDHEGDLVVMQTDSDSLLERHAKEKGFVGKFSSWATAGSVAFPRSHGHDGRGAHRSGYAVHRCGISSGFFFIYLFFFLILYIYFSLCQNIGRTSWTAEQVSVGDGRLGRLGLVALGSKDAAYVLGEACRHGLCGCASDLARPQCQKASRLDVLRVQCCVAIEHCASIRR